MKSIDAPVEQVRDADAGDVPEQGDQGGQDEAEAGEEQVAEGLRR